MCLLFVLLAANARAAATYYFHIDGTATAYGINANANVSWDGVSWSTTATGAPTADYAGAVTAGGAGGVFPRFNSTTTPYTITCNNSEAMAGLYGAAGVNVIIAASGGGNLNILPSASLTAGLPTQGFFSGGAGGTVTINAPIIGTGGVNIPTGGGTIQLFGNNTYSGGTSISSSATLTSFNNDNSFGTGPICLNSSVGSFATVLSTGGSAGSPLTITLANSWSNFLGGYVNFASAAYTPVICTGPMALGTFNTNIRENGDTTASLTLNGVISGSGTLTFSANNGGKVTLGGANTYTGKTSISGGSNLAGVGMTVSVGSLNKVSGGSPTSNLGAPTTVANGTIGIGITSFTSTLIYTGLGETTDRVIDLAGTTGGAVLQADGSGALVLTANNTATGAGAKTLTLQGSSTAANSIGKIVNSSAATAVAKAQAGTWKLTGANTYTGDTTIGEGTLEVSGSIAGNVTHNAGILRLDNAAALSPIAVVSLSSAGTVDLNYSGTQVINTLIIDGTPIYSGVWGSLTSTAANKNPIFTGNGLIQVVSPPIIPQQPQSMSVYPDSSYTFSVVAAGDPSFTYQWKRNGAPILNATDPSLLINPAEVADAGTYVCWITNSVGWTNTLNATLTILATNDYVNAIRAASPIAYWRLDETNGTVANDWIGLHAGNYINANLNRPGFSVVPGSDPCMGVPSNVSQKGYMVISNCAPFSFPAGATFTLEAWGMSTNFAAGVKQRLISTLTLTGNGGYGFGFPNNTTLELTAGGVADFDSTLPTPLASGVWYHFVVTCDGYTYVSYLNGNPVGSRAVAGLGIQPPAGQLTVGNNPLAYPSEQLYGGIDEVAIYSYALDQNTITNHYLARYTDAALTVSAPVVTPSTNYVTLSATLTGVASGAGLTYQWYHGAGTGSPVATGTDATLILYPLQLSDAGNYHVVVTDAGNHTADSPLAYLAVVPIPTSASELNLTNGLVLHLPFDSDYKDISGRNNNGSAVGSPTLGASGAIGSGALHYGTTNGVSTNYVTVGVRPDLQFGDVTGPDFTVSYWVRGTINTDLPFFCDAAGGEVGILALAGGFYFGPNTTANGGWAYGTGSIAHESSSSGANIINDGNWHHLVHVAKRIGNMTTYLDGAQVDVHAIGYVTDSINTTNPANIGQDGTGAQVFADQGGDIDDLAVWTRTLTPFEVSGIYLAGATNNVSFAPVVVVLAPTTISNIIGTTLTYGGGSGSQFVLMGTNQLSTTHTGWERLNTNNATPGTFTIPLTGAAQFYYIKSE